MRSGMSPPRRSPLSLLCRRIRCTVLCPLLAADLRARIIPRRKGREEHDVV